MYQQGGKVLGIVHTRSKSLWNWLGDVQTLWNDFGFSLCFMPSICHIVTTSDKKKKTELEVSTNSMLLLNTRGQVQ